MRIAQVAPLAEAVPPRLYGGTERIVSFLTEELVALGHDVTLFASGDSVTSAQLVPMVPHALRLDRSVRDWIAPMMLMLEKVAQMADAFDIIHFHLDYLPFPLARRLRTPHITTLHGRLDLPELGPIFEEFTDAPVVSISDSQRGPLPMADWIRTIHHGVPLPLFRAGPGDGGYVAFIGRIAPEKGLDKAIRICGDAGMPIRIAAKVDDADRRYFDSHIRQLLDLPHVQFLGEIDDHRKDEFLGRAAALLFPIDWPEPFGLVTIESMACGTPVIAFDRGAAPEIVRSGIDGFVVRDEQAALESLYRVREIDRAGVRRSFEERFTSRRMAEDYLEAYRNVSRRHRPRFRVVQGEA